VSGLLGSLSKSLGRREAEERRTPHTPARSLRRVAIDWDRDPEALRRGDLSGLATDVADAIRAAAQLPEVMHLAKMLVLDPVVVIIALIAHERGRGNRSAQRIAQTILGNARSADIECAVLELAL
jgi:hypothetical protein